jgi:DNA-directed RNA polymerase specialized sigma24 family protein
VQSFVVTFDRKTFLSDPSLLAALGAHVRSRVPAADADDVVQSVIADALASQNAPDDEGAMKRWLFGVARNKIADFYRRTRRELPTDEEDAVAAPSSGREGAGDLLRWAEEELPPGSDAKRTFEWMLREGEGEKLESIAASEKLPAPRVRKRVSRMREHFRARWAAYVAALAAAGLAVILVFYIFRKKPEPEAIIVPETHPSVPSATVSATKTPDELAHEERSRALEACDRADWVPCLEGLDRAALVDPAGDRAPRVVAARAAAAKALAPPPPPSSVPTVAPTSTPTTPTTAPHRTSVTPTSGSQ